MPVEPFTKGSPQIVGSSEVVSRFENYRFMVVIGAVETVED